MENETHHTTKHYDLALSKDLMDQLRAESKRQGETMSTLIRKYCRLGIKVEKVIDDGGQIFLQEGETQTEIIL